jgi:hypothetical protein
MLMVEHGRDMESRDSRSRTPLHVSSCCGRTEVVSLLVDRGADMDSETDEGKTALHLASWEHYDRIRRCRPAITRLRRRRELPGRRTAVA